MASRNTGFTFTLIGALTAAAFWAWGPSPANPMGQVTRGLDLAGGAQLVYRIRVEDLPEDQRSIVLAQAAEVVQKRLGILAEAKVVKHGSDRLLVQMPSADQQAVEDLKEQIRKSGRLEFRMVIDERSDRPELYRRALKNKEKSLPPPPGTHWYGVIGDSGVKDEVLVDDRVEMTGADINPQRISVSHDEQFRPAVSLEFTPAGTEAMDRIARKAFPTRQRMAIILNDVRALPTEEEKKRDAGAPGRILEQGVCYSAPAIQAEHFGGQAQISGQFTPKELADLTGVFQAGSLPAPLELERQMQVGSSLGEDQMAKGQRACLWGAALVIAFMVAYYLLPGAVAAFALVLNIVLLLGIMGGLGATLTLPGMAGIVLTLGMAVDANVLIFERIREELAAGKAVAQAIPAGYDRAFVTILDANVTTIISAVVLYAMGSEQVQGFAVTLSLGLVASLFTSIVVTRAVFDLALGKGWMRGFRTLRLLPATAIDFVRPAPWCMACSAVLIAGGLFHLLVIQGRDMLAVDFTGGRILQLRFAEGKTIQDVRARVAGVLTRGGYPEGADAQVQSLRPAGGLDTGLPRDFQIVTRNLDLDQDRVRDLARTALGAALKHAPAEMPGDSPERLSFMLDFTSPQDPVQVAQALAKAGLKGAEVSPVGNGAAGRATQARLVVTPHRLLEELKAAFGRELVPSAFQVAPGEAQAHTRVLCAVRDMTEAEVRARLESAAVNLKGCRVAVEAPDARGVSALRIESPVQDVEEVKKRLLRYFGPELCLQDVPYAKVHPDGSCDVEIRLDSPLSMMEIGSRQTDMRKQLGLELGSSGRVIEDADPANPGNAVKALSMNYKSGMKDLMQYLNFVRKNLPLVEPFREAVAVPAMARLSFSVVDAGKGLEPAQRAAQSVGGTVLDASLQPHTGGFHAAMEVPAPLVGRTQGLLRKGYTEDLSDPIPRDDVVGGVVAGEAVVKTGWAMVAAWAALILYMAFRFEFISGVAAVVALVHDVLVTLGVLSFTHTQIDMTIVAALLTIIGFSVNDTIVILDRVRENLGGKWNVTAETFGRVVNLSVNQTLSRTLLTSLTVFISVVSLFMGGEVFRGFGIAMLAGVVSGTYSTVYIAAPLVQFWRRRAAPPQAA